MFIDSILINWEILGHRSNSAKVQGIPSVHWGHCLCDTSLRRNGTPALFDVLPFEINNENYFLLIGFICTLFYNFPHSSVG